MILALLLSVGLYCFSYPNAFVVEGFWPAAWFALIPLFYCLNSADVKTRLWIGIIFGISVYSLLLFWLWPIHLVGTILFILVLSIQPVLFAIFFRPIDQSNLNLIYVPALWVASECIRALVLNGFSFSFAYSQSFVPNLIQSASWGGTYSVVFILVIFNYSFYLFWKLRQKRMIYSGLALGFFALNLLFGAVMMAKDSQEATITISGIQPNILPDQKVNLHDFDGNIESHLQLTRGELNNKAVDMVVWPETSFPADIFLDKAWFIRLKEFVVELQTVLVFGVVPHIQDENLNSAAVIDAHGNLNGLYHKIFLVPFSEFLPKLFFLKWFPKLIYQEKVGFASGQKQEIFHVISQRQNKMDFGILICSESCYPKAARKLADKGARFIVVMLNDGWFKQPAAIMMHAQNSIFRAIETGRDIISVANTGLTFHVNHHGFIGSQNYLAWQQRRVGTFYIQQRNQPTVYRIIGDFFAEACMLFVIIILIFKDKFKPKRP
jgi:apolipoprotein N-acyltransferase